MIQKERKSKLTYMGKRKIVSWQIDMKKSGKCEQGIKMHGEQSGIIRW